MENLNYSKVPAGTFIEFQVIILTNDENNFANELFDNKCKGLIKICNRCMIYYILKNIIEQKLKYITIVVNNKYYNDMVNYINEAFPDNYKFDDKKIKNNYCIDIEPYSTNDNEEIGSIQCLLHIKNKIKTDFIVLNCDILGFVDFHSLANLFRGENALCGILLLEDNEPKNTERKKKEIKEEYLNLQNKVWACIDKNSKVVCIKDTLSMKQDGKMKISKINLLFHKNFILKTDLVDNHVYIFNHHVLNILEHKKNKFTSIKYDLIPYLIKIQNLPRAASYCKSEFKFNMYSKMIDKYEGLDDSDEIKKELTLLDIVDNENVKSVVCYVQSKINGFCQRINNIENYFKANLLFCVHRHDQLKNVLPPFCFFLLTEKNQTFRDCIISNNFSHEKNVFLKKSILGKNVKIKNNTTINRSILLDNITVNENCVIQNSIICDNVIIENNCKLIDCILRENCVIEKNSIFEKETLPLFIPS